MNAAAVRISKRTDCHRPSAILPSDYEYILSFSLATTADGWPVPAMGINCEIERRQIAEDGTVIANGTHSAYGQCCVIGMRQEGYNFFGESGPGRCTVCGTHYVYGDLWLHRPTKELVCLGHDCADKYSLLADRSAWEMANLRLRGNVAREAARERNNAEREEFLAKHPGLREALQFDHHIVADIAAKFHTFRSLSDAQVALVFKIATEPKRVEEAHVPAPVSDKRVTFRGVVVGTKVYDSQFGTSYKMTVKVATPEGSWLAWGTIPNAMFEETDTGGCRYTMDTLKGCIVEITARLEAGREPHFALMSRPKGRVVSAVEMSL